MSRKRDRDRAGARRFPRDLEENRHGSLRNLRQRVRQAVRGHDVGQDAYVRQLRVRDPRPGADLPALRHAHHRPRGGAGRGHLLLRQLRSGGGRHQGPGPRLGVWQRRRGSPNPGSRERRGSRCASCVRTAFPWSFWRCSRCRCWGRRSPAGAATTRAATCIESRQSCCGLHREPDASSAPRWRAPPVEEGSTQRVVG